MVLLVINSISCSTGALLLVFDYCSGVALIWCHMYSNVTVVAIVFSLLYDVARGCCAHYTEILLKKNEIKFFAKKNKIIEKESFQAIFSLVWMICPQVN